MVEKVESELDKWHKDIVEHYVLLCRGLCIILVLLSSDQIAENKHDTQVDPVYNVLLNFGVVAYLVVKHILKPIDIIQLLRGVEIYKTRKYTTQSHKHPVDHIPVILFPAFVERAVDQIVHSQLLTMHNNLFLVLVLILSISLCQVLDYLTHLHHI